MTKESIKWGFLNFNRMILITILTLVYLSCSAQQSFVFDYPFCFKIGSEGAVMDNSKSDSNNAYQVKWSISGNNVMIEVSEVSINSDGKAKIIKNIDSLRLNVAEDYFSNSKDMFTIGSDDIEYLRMLPDDFLIRIGRSIYSLGAGDMYLYEDTNDVKWRSRTQKYHTEEKERLVKALCALNWKVSKK